MGSKESAGIARVGYWTVENESGATLTRPELFRLLSDAHAGDILLVEQVDRLSRLKGVDWERLKAELATRNVRVVALDLPTSWMLATKHPDEFTSRMFEAVNGMMLDMLAAVARKDYDDRRRRQNQGIAQAKAEGRTTADQRTLSATSPSRACSRPVSPTAPYRPLRTVRGRPSRR